MSVPVPALRSDFDAVQDHRRRYRRRTLQEACSAIGLSEQRIVWWRLWMVPVLWIPRHRRRRRGPKSAAEAYRRYLRRLAWPAAAFISLADRADRLLTLNGISLIGSSLFAAATRSPSS